MAGGIGRRGHREPDVRRCRPSRSPRTTGPAAGLWLGEVVATARADAGHLRCPRAPAAATGSAYAVGAYITAAYWFTSSTSFANPAVTIARMFSEHLRRHRPRLSADVRRSCSCSAAALALPADPAAVPEPRPATAADLTADTTTADNHQPRHHRPPTATNTRPTTSADTTAADPPNVVSPASPMRRAGTGHGLPMLGADVGSGSWLVDRPPTLPDRFPREVVAPPSTTPTAARRLASVTQFLPTRPAAGPERLDARAQAEGKTAKRVPEVLFVCVQNSGRSQMAAALTRHLAGDRCTSAPPDHSRANASSPKSQP